MISGQTLFFYSDGATKRSEGDFLYLLQQLGEEEWELISVSPRSGRLGGTSILGGGLSVVVLGTQLIDKPKDYAGFTDTEIWVFKRLMNK